LVLSELVLLKQNIGTSGGDSTPHEVKSLNLSLIEGESYRINKLLIATNGSIISCPTFIDNG